MTPARLPHHGRTGDNDTDVAASVFEMTTSPTSPEPTASTKSPQILEFGEPAGGPGGASDRSSLTEGLRSLPEPVRDYLARYTSSSAPERVRVEITSFVVDATIAVAPQNPFTVEQVTAPLARLAVWAHHERAMPLVARLLLSPEVIELFVTTQIKAGVLKPGTARNYRAHLERCARAAGFATNGTPRPIRRDEKSRPYGPEEVADFGLWARARAGERSRIRAQMILALIAGAGMRNEEVVALRAEDIIGASDIWLRVRGTHDRLVPVRPEWAPTIRARVEPLTTGDFVYPDGGNAALGHITRWLSESDGAPQAQRLRATWFARHLADRTDPADLLAWSGVERGESLVGLLPFLPGGVDENLRRELVQLRLLPVSERAPN